MQAVVNEDLAGDAALLKAEIGRLADQLAQARAEIALHKVCCLLGALRALASPLISHPVPAASGSRWSCTQGSCC